MAKTQTPAPQATELVPQRSELIEFLDHVKGMEPDKLEKALQVFKDAQLWRAEIEFNEALTRAKKRFGPVRKDQKNPLYQSKYASFNALMEACEDALEEEGINVSFLCRPTADPNVLGLALDLSKGMYSRHSERDWPVSVEGPRGGRPAMTAIQAQGSAMTYARRYMLQGALNLRADPNTDDDGNSARTRQGPPNLAELVAAFAPFGVTEQQIVDSRYNRDQLTSAYREITRDATSVARWFPSITPTKGNAGLREQLINRLNAIPIPPAPGEEDELGSASVAGGGDPDPGADFPGNAKEVTNDPFEDLLGKPRLSEIKLTKKSPRGGWDWDRYADDLITAIAECGDVQQIYEIRATDNLTFGMKNNAPLRLGEVLGALAEREKILRS